MSEILNNEALYSLSMTLCLVSSEISTIIVGLFGSTELIVSIMFENFKGIFYTILLINENSIEKNNSRKAQIYKNVIIVVTFALIFFFTSAIIFGKVFFFTKNVE